MKSKRAIPALTALLLATGCLYTESQVQSRFRLQVFHTTEGRVTVSNQSDVELELCDHGDTDRYCSAPRALPGNHDLVLGYRVRSLLRPMPEELCPTDEPCITGDLDARPENVWAEGSAYLAIDNQQGMAVSIREKGARAGSRVVVAGDLRSGDGCFTLVISDADEFDGQSESLVSEAGEEIAFARWDETDCSPALR